MKKRSEGTMMIGFIAFAFVVGCFLGCFGLKVSAALLISLLAAAVSILIGAAQVAHFGIAYLSIAAENLGPQLVGIIVALQLGYICGLVLLYGAPRSLHQVRTLLHH